MVETRRPTEVRRTEIADAALRVIGTKGIAALTMAALAAEVGMTSGALFRHFASRDEILEEVGRRAEALIAATFPPDDLPPLERLERLVRQRPGAVGANPGLARLAFSEQLSLALPPAAVARLRGIVARSRAYMEKALDEAARAGLVRDDVAAADLALVVMGTMRVVAFSHADGMGAGLGAPVTPERAWRTLRALLAPPRPATRRASRRSP